MKKSALFVLSVLLLSALPLPAAAAPVEILYFYSPSCSHCRVVSGIMTNVADEYGGTVSITRINISAAENQAIWTQYKMNFTINGVPTIIINDERKLEGDIKITFAAVCAIVDELLGGMDSRGNELYNLGTSAMRNGQFDTAIDYFEQAIEIFELSENVEKIALCEDKIAACHTYIAAQAAYVAAETHYYAGRYADAIPLYEEVIALYTSLGESGLASKGEIRLLSCRFFVTYDAALASYEERQWAEARSLFEEAKTYTSKKETIDAINEYLDHCSSQLSAEALFEEAESLFEEGAYADAKVQYQEAASLFTSADRVTLCTARVQLCDAYLLAQDTFDYGMALYEDGSYQEAVVVFGSAREKYAALGDSERVAACDAYATLASDALAERERQQAEEEQARRDARNRRLLLGAGLSALAVIALSLAIILHGRKPVVRTVYEPEDAAEDEEDEGESEDIE
jgi:tetratricopeptide (TPR) repeat protein